MSREDYSVSVLEDFVNLRNQWLKDLVEVQEDVKNSSSVQIKVLKNNINNYDYREKN